ncbi:MAG: hypothetical protein KAT00_01910 [Planctomycetes bacterium]|nr:hypothetical protein [Planctomycetota bacterium]
MSNDAEKKNSVAFDIAADWLSFSLPHPFGGGEEVNKADDVYTNIYLRWPELKITRELREVSRPPYKAVFKLGIGGQVLFSELVAHILIEIQGAGCRTLEDSGDFYAVATRAIAQAMNITRFDLAVDFETDTDPEVFAKSRGQRWKAFGTMESETGKTAYVGAPKSARRARVYRYATPHERAHLLRVEMVMKKPRAVGAVLAYLHNGPAEYAAMAGNAFGWHHPLWNFTSKDKITAWSPERGSASTLRWIRNAVIPSLSRLYETGVLPNEHSIWAAIAEVTPLLLPEPAENDPPLLIGGSKSFDPPSSTLPLPGVEA